LQYIKIQIISLEKYFLMPQTLRSLKAAPALEPPLPVGVADMLKVIVQEKQ
jgi:hypothetical protein